MTMRIALVTYAMNCGGMETFLLRLASVLQRAGHEVDFITTEHRGEWFDRVSDLGFRALHYGPDNPTDPVSALALAIRTGRRLARGRYDVVFLNHARYAQAALGMLSERTVAVPILHNTFEGIFTVGCANQRRCNVVVAPGPSVAERAAARLSGPPVTIIPYGVEIPAESRVGRRRPFELPLRMLFVGRLEHGQKGILFLPDILKGCLDRGVQCSLEVVGDGPDRALLEQRLVDLKVDSHCRLSGRIDEPTAVYERFLDSHVLLLPSFFEGLPIVPLEAQACGCVPIASHLRGITDCSIEDGRSGILVRPADVDGFVRAVVTLCDEPSRWAAISAQAHDTAKRRFSVEAMGQAYLELIADLRHGKYPRPRSRRFAPIDLSLFSWRECLPAPVRKIKRGVAAVLSSVSRGSREVRK
jgi:glycosyltransferase involved in cell wall biosynthesis